MNKHSRRRFLIDLTFIGGGLLCAMGGVWLVQPEVKPAEAATPTPSPSPRRLAKGEQRAPQPSPRQLLRGEPAAPQPQPSHPPYPGESL